MQLCVGIFFCVQGHQQKKKKSGPKLPWLVCQSFTYRLFWLQMPICYYILFLPPFTQYLRNSSLYTLDTHVGFIEETTFNYHALHLHAKSLIKITWRNLKTSLMIILIPWQHIFSTGRDAASSAPSCSCGSARRVWELGAWPWFSSVGDPWACGFSCGKIYASCLSVSVWWLWGPGQQTFVPCSCKNNKMET